MLRRGIAIDCRDFVSVYNACYADVARWVRALGGSAADLPDLVQEVFVVVHRRLADFDGENLIAWLYRITAHRVRDYRRSTWIKHIFQRSVEVTSDVATANPTQLMMLETRQKQKRLERMLSRVSSDNRATFILFEVEGYTAEEIANIQGITIHTVRTRIQRTRKRLVEMIEAERAQGGKRAWNR